MLFVKPPPPPVAKAMGGPPPHRGGIKNILVLRWFCDIIIASRKGDFLWLKSTLIWKPFCVRILI